MRDSFLSIGRGGSDQAAARAIQQRVLREVAQNAKPVRTVSRLEIALCVTAASLFVAAILRVWL